MLDEARGQRPTSSSSATLDSRSAVGKTRGVNETPMLPEGLGPGSSRLLFGFHLLMSRRERKVVYSTKASTERKVRLSGAFTGSVCLLFCFFLLSPLPHR